VISYRALHSGWTLTGPDVPAVPATVPGCVHTDLLAAGLIPAPFLDENETSLAWIGRSDWVYETTFTHDGTDDRVDLVCAGLDTVATVELNRVELGRTANMHRGYRFDVRPALITGENRLRITFESAYAYAEAQQKRLGQAVDANVNYLRVWGGGRYESEDFYDLADAYGLMVGQDFLFACAAYPEEEPFASEVAAEARENVVRLSSHPSLMVWTGNNENLWGHEDWGWKDQLGNASWGAGFYFDVLPRIVSEADPTRPYWPGSPYSGGAHHPNDPAHGTMHIWDVWNTDDYPKYRSYQPRFVGEFGFQAPPTYSTLRTSTSDDLLTPAAAHQKALGGDAKLQRGLDNHLPPPRDFDDWHYFTQLNQARAVAYGIEHFRSLRPYCMGAIMWQLNDCWPVTSWAAVDGGGRRKPLWYAMRRAVGDRRAGAAVTIPLPSAPADLIVASAGGTRAWWFFAEDKDIVWPLADFDASTEVDGDTVRVHITARTILRDLTIYPDRLDPSASADDAVVTVLPGESVTFTISGAAGLDPVALTRRPVLRCINDF
jgi:beta-mannosidase